MIKSNKYLKPCKECNASCCRFGGPIVTEIEREIIVRAGYQDYFIKSDDGLYVVEGVDYACPYLDDKNSCSIQEVKPRLCRIWPVVPFDKNGERKYMIAECPLTPYVSEGELEEGKKDAEKLPIEIIKRTWNLPEEVQKRVRKFKMKKWKETRIK